MRRLLGKSAALSIAFCAGLALPAAADPVQPRAIAPTKPMFERTFLGELVQKAAIPQGRYGFVLMDAQTGEVLSARNEDALFIPASLSKIPTTLLTLATADTDQRFETKLLANGPLTDGILNGDLHLVGSGDPSLRTQDLTTLAAHLSRAGITRVTGKFFYHADAIPTAQMIDAMQPKGKHYNPAVSGLNVNHNLQLVDGLRVPIANPALYAAQKLRARAKAKGITLPLPLRAQADPVGTPVAIHRSAPMDQIVKRMMARSTNLTAEALGAIAAGSLGQQPASLHDASRISSDWIITNSDPIGGTEWGGFHLANHSGLSTRSKATPRQMAAILRLGYQRFGSRFVDLHKRVKPAGYQAYDLHGKIGTMRFVRGYAGFLTVGGRDMVFAIMSNDATRRALADQGTPGLNSGGWMSRARKVEHALLSDWISEHWMGDTVAQAEPQPIITAPQAIITQPTVMADPVVAMTTVTTMRPVRTTQPVYAMQPISNTQPLVRVSIPAQPAGYVRSTRTVE